MPVLSHPTAAAEFPIRDDRDGGELVVVDDDDAASDDATAQALAAILRKRVPVLAPCRPGSAAIAPRPPGSAGGVRAQMPRSASQSRANAATSRPSSGVVPRPPPTRASGRPLTAAALREVAKSADDADDAEPLYKAYPPVTKHTSEWVAATVPADVSATLNESRNLTPPLLSSCGGSPRVPEPAARDDVLPSRVMPRKPAGRTVLAADSHTARSRISVAPEDSASCVGVRVDVAKAAGMLAVLRARDGDAAPTASHPRAASSRPVNSRRPTRPETARNPSRSRRTSEAVVAAPAPAATARVRPATARARVEVPACAPAATANAAATEAAVIATPPRQTAAASQGSPTSRTPPPRPVVTSATSPVPLAVPSTVADVLKGTLAGRVAAAATPLSSELLAGGCAAGATSTTDDASAQKPKAKPAAWNAKLAREMARKEPMARGAPVPAPRSASARAPSAARRVPNSAKPLFLRVKPSESFLYDEPPELRSPAAAAAGQATTTAAAELSPNTQRRRRMQRLFIDSRGEKKAQAAAAKRLEEKRRAYAMRPTSPRRFATANLATLSEAQVASAKADAARFVLGVWCRRRCAAALLVHAAAVREARDEAIAARSRVARQVELCVAAASKLRAGFRVYLRSRVYNPRLVLAVIALQAVWRGKRCRQSLPLEIRRAEAAVVAATLRRTERAEYAALVITRAARAALWRARCRNHMEPRLAAAREAAAAAAKAAEEAAAAARAPTLRRIRATLGWIQLQRVWRRFAAAREAEAEEFRRRVGLLRRSS